MRDLEMGKEDLKKLGTENRKNFMHAVDSEIRVGPY